MLIHRSVSVFLLEKPGPDSHAVKIAAANIATEIVRTAAEGDQAVGRAVYALGNLCWRDAAVARHVALTEAWTRIRQLESSADKIVADAARAAKGAIDAAVV